MVIFRRRPADQEVFEFKSILRASVRALLATGTRVGDRGRQSGSSKVFLPPQIAQLEPAPLKVSR